MKLRLWYRAGTDLVCEPVETGTTLAQAIRDSASPQGIDGALELRDGTRCLLDERTWDRLDGMLLAWIGGCDALVSGADASVAIFPDTRVEAVLTREGQTGVRVRVEDVDEVVGLEALREELLRASARFLSFAGACGLAPTEAMERLRKRES